MEKPTWLTAVEQHLAPKKSPRRKSPRARANAWEQALLDHRGHDGFRPQSWAYSREIGFSCDCDGCEHEWRMDLVTIRMMMLSRADREDFERRRRGIHKESRRASLKARALLHYHLTKEQRKELRGTKAFTLAGADGKTYRITEGTTSNVYLLEEGQPVMRFCVVVKETALPMYDLLLAQKLMLESDPEQFWKIAVKTDLRKPASAPLNPIDMAREVARRFRERTDDAVDAAARRLAG